MAIEYNITGNFELSAELKHALLRELGEQAQEPSPESSAVVFRLVSPILSVAGISTDRPEYAAMIYFRVLDKALVVEATSAAIRCTRAVLDTIDDDVAFWADETLLLRRKNGSVRLHEPSQPKDRYEPGKSKGHPYWSSYRRHLIEDRKRT
jgi:hypothetical protein